MTARVMRLREAAARRRGYAEGSVAVSPVLPPAPPKLRRISLVSESGRGASSECKTAVRHPEADWPLAAYIEQWLVVYKRGLVKSTTYDTLERVYLAYVKEAVGATRLCELTPEQIQGHLVRLKEIDGYSYSTVKKVYDLLNASLRNAVQRGVLLRNPMDLVAMPKKSHFPQNEVAVFSVTECTRIIEEAQREASTGRPVYVYGDAIILTLLTGVRIGELIGLTRDDYDPIRRTIRVQRNIHKVRNRDENGDLLPGRMLVPTTTKSYSGNREIPLTTQAVCAIERMLSVWPLSPYIVNNSKGRMATPEQIDRTFHVLLRNCGLADRGTGMHKLRHTFASLLFAHGVDVKSISKLLGHASASVTLNVYTHLFEQVPYSAVTPLDELF